MFHVYCFLMMINIMHNRIWLTHRGGGGLHFSFACFNQCNNFDQSGQLCPWAIHICTIMGNNRWDLWNILTISVSIVSPGREPWLEKLPKSVRLTGNPWYLTGLTLIVAHNVATVKQHDTLVELIHSKIHFNINMSNNCKRQLHYTYFFKMASDESLLSSFGGISNN